VLRPPVWLTFFASELQSAHSGTIQSSLSRSMMITCAPTLPFLAENRSPHCGQLSRL